jgi:hypothetical protein
MDKPNDTTGITVRVECSPSPATLSDWDTLVEESPLSSPFATHSFVEAACESLDARVAFFGAYREETLVAGALLPTKPLGWNRRAIVTPFTPYTAVLFGGGRSHSDSSKNRQVLEALISRISEHCALAHLHLPPSIVDVRPLEWRGWRMRPLYTYSVPLTGDPDPWKSWSEGPRRTFLKNRSRYSVEEQSASVHTIASLCLDGYRRHGRRPPLRGEGLERLVHSMCDAGQASLFTAADGHTGRVAAGLAVLHDSSTAYYWVAGSEPGAAMTVLVGETLVRMRDRGIQLFDFMGANTPGIAEFKRRFGATLTTYFRAEWASGLAARIYQRLR